MVLSRKSLLTLVPAFLQIQSAVAVSGTGTTTRYWDCCKPSCAWPGKTTLIAGSSPVAVCDVNDNILDDVNAASGCNGGTAFMPSTQSPWAVSDDLAYGYAAVNIAGGSENSWCCACYELTFTSGAVAGKKMIVQATNTGGDLAGNQFDISMPGGGVGIFNGCTAEWGAPSTGWGAQYGGVGSRSDCDAFPEALKAGCYWRFDWFQGADNPAVSFKSVACPAALTAKTGCVRADDTPVGDSVVATVGRSKTSTVASSSSTPVKVAAVAASSEAPSASSGSDAVELTPAGSTTANAVVIPKPSVAVVEIPQANTIVTIETAVPSYGPATVIPIAPAFVAASGATEDATITASAAPFTLAKQVATSSPEPTTTLQSTTTITDYITIKPATTKPPVVTVTVYDESYCQHSSSTFPVVTVTVYDYAVCSKSS